MRAALPTRRFLAAGFALSLAVHLGIAVVANRTPISGGATRTPVSQPVEMAILYLPEPEPPPPEPDRVELGLQQSTHETEAWVGFEDPTEHQANLSEVEQSAMTPQPPGAQPSAGAPEPSPSRPEPQPAEQLELPPTPAAEPPEQPEPAPPTPPLPPADDPILANLALEPTEPLDTPIDTTDPQQAPDALTPLPSPPPASLAFVPDLQVTAEPLLLLPAPTIEATADAERSTPEDAPADALPPSAPAPQGSNAPAGEGGDTAGERSPSESTAASLTAPIQVRPGRVAAAQGLEITTVRPVYDIATIATARPRSPTLLIEFGKDGQVRRARFLPGRSTGERGVDQPLLDAVYRWTAKGEALARLSDDPEDTVAITMRIILR